MDPGIWSALPKELVQLILARLPLADIFRLRVLSKEWNRDVITRESEFRQLCAATQSKIFGIIAEGDPWGSFILRFYDIKSHQWHTLCNSAPEYILMPESPWHSMGATDGGLVCFIERLKNKETNPLSIVVCNPLIGKLHVLPLPEGDMKSVQPSMVQLVMDEDSKAYKVIVVSPTKPPRGTAVVKVYHSASDAWTSSNSVADFVFGELYEWKDGVETEEDTWLDGMLVAPFVLDCAAGQLLDLCDDSYPCVGKSVIDYALLKDRLFVLHALGSVPDLSYVTTERRCGPYSVTEYRGQKAHPNWIKLGEYRSTIDLMFTSPTDDYFVELFACKGILLLIARTRDGHEQGDLAQFCDLCTGEWHNIPTLPRNINASDDETMCELRWDAFP